LRQLWAIGVPIANAVRRYGSAWESISTTLASYLASLAAR
jgi:hypothetical protein